MYPKNTIDFIFFNIYMRKKANVLPIVSSELLIDTVVPTLMSSNS